MDMTTPRRDNPLGTYLKDRRARLDAVALGYAATRRRTPGLRREEVAQRASISPTWYTWLEQGRGGAPSTEVLDRLAKALMLGAVEREHLFLLALGHPPALRVEQDTHVPPRLQRVLDAMAHSPAFVRTLTWDIVCWNRPAAAVFGFGEQLNDDRNILRRIFCHPRSRSAQLDWDSVARFAVAAFRADAARARPSADIDALVRDLSRLSPDFARMWENLDVASYGDGVKHLRHDVVGLISMEYSSFVVDGRPDLAMVVYNPATSEDMAKMRALLAEGPARVVPGAP